MLEEMLRSKLSRLGVIQIIDDRGATCKLVPPPEQWPKASWRGRPRESLDHAMSAEWEWATKASGAFGALAGASMVLTMSAARWLLQPLPPIPGWIGSILPAIVAGVLFRPAYLPVARYQRHKLGARLRDAYVRTGRCASCGYSLAGLPATDAGCVECPECSHAWRIIGAEPERSQGETTR